MRSRVPLPRKRSSPPPPPLPTSLTTVPDMSSAPPSYAFLSKSQLRPWFEGCGVAIVGSAPSVLDNLPGLIDSHDVVVRVNNYKLRGEVTGRRTDVFYSFFGNSIRKAPSELLRDGVKLCMCKCPDASAIESAWHRRNNALFGVDFRWIYELRKDWWFCDVYVPTLEDFLAGFELLDRHIPSTGFAAILEILACNPKQVYLTGFDFFTSGRHNVDEPWRRKNNGDPIGHVPEKELEWLRMYFGDYPLTVDTALMALLS